MLTQIFHEILSNQVVTGLSFTAAVGAVLYEIKSWPGAIWAIIKPKLFTTVTIKSNHRGFDDVHFWIKKQNFFKKIRNIALSDPIIKLPEFDGIREEISVGYGTHWFFWHKRLVILNRYTDDKSATQTPCDIIIIKIFPHSRKSINYWKHELEEIKKENKKMFTYYSNDEWFEKIQTNYSRSLDSIFLNNGEKEKIIHDVQSFLDSEIWYHERGIPWHRGYLFYGAPGTGKTSLTQAISSHFKWPLYIVNLNDLLRDSQLTKLIAFIPFKSIILFEDIDVAMNDKAQVTLGAIFNILDGVLTPDGVIFIMTTNNPSVINPTMIRPGRIDYYAEFQLLDRTEQKKMARNFYNEPFDPPMEFIEAAKLQQAFLRYPNDVQKATEFLGCAGENKSATGDGKVIAGSHALSVDLSDKT